MSKPEIERYKEFSDWFLKLFAIQVLVLGNENWDDLPVDAATEGVLPILAGLTHKDYVDGPVLWAALADIDLLLHLVVMKEGFSGGLNEIRSLVSSKVAPTLTLSRNSTGANEIKRIQAIGDENGAVGLFLSGNRRLTSPLKGGVTTLMRPNDTFYPFVNLSDKEPVFPSGSGLVKNASELFSRLIFDRQTSTEFLYLLKPLKKEEIDFLAEGKKSKAGREEILAKLEVIRAYGILKMFLEVTNLSLAVINPLLQNSDNWPLLLWAKKHLQDNHEKTEWLVKSGYFSSEDLLKMLALDFDHE